MLRTALAAALILTPTLASAEILEGVYRTEANEEGAYLEVTFGACESDASLTCGTITRAMTPDGPGEDYEHLGRLIVENMEGGPTEWSDGTIWAPDDDETYRSNMELSGTTLAVEGCFLFICRGQNWEAVN